MKMEHALIAVLCISLIASSFSVFYIGVKTGELKGYFEGTNYGYRIGYGEGFFNGSATVLENLKIALKQEGITLTVKEVGQGKYSISIVSDAFWFKANATFHLEAIQERNGSLIASSYHPMTITTYGKNQIEQLLGDNSDLGLAYFGLSNDETAVNVAWTELPSEITANGLGRAVAAYTSTGDGTWNMTKTWTATGTQSCCLYGVYSNSYAGGQTTLCLAEQQTSSARKNLVASDTLKMTVQGTVA